MKQLLINYLSTLNNPKDDQNYYYFDLEEDPNKGVEFEGFQTNEPIVRYCALAAKDGDVSFDHIISICSKRVESAYCAIEKEKIDNISVLRDLKAYIENDNEDSEYYRIQHFKFFSDNLRNICKEYNVSVPRIHTCSISDQPSDAEVRDMIVEVGNKVTECIGGDYKNYRLVLDCTGGDRSAAVMMIALTKMLEERGFKEIKLLGTNYFFGSKPDDRCPVRYKAEMSDIFDLITGTRIFLDYGDSIGLTKFFKNIDLPENEMKILETIQQFSDSLKLCSPNGITQNLGHLANLVNKTEKRKGNSSGKRDLFNYLLAEIKADVGVLADRDKRTEINIIKWCLRKGLIQQAVTLYVETIPKALVRQRIVYYPMSSNWDSVDRVERIARNKQICIYKDKIRNQLTYKNFQYLGTDRQNEIKESPYSLEINFINNYLTKALLNNMHETEVVKIGKAYRQGSKKSELVTNIRNYKEFKSSVRNGLMHANFKEGKMTNLIGGRLVLKHMHIREEKISPKAITMLISDLVEQLEELGMK